jgi:hypothetical protein
VNPNSYDALARSIGAVAFLLPTPQVFQDTILVSTPDGNYTASDFPELLDMVGANITSQMLIDMASLRNFSAPGVPLHCVVGYNLSTVATVDYPTGFGGNITSTSEDGDGVVLSQSLDVCDGWNTTQTQPINTIRVPNMQHGDPVFDPQVISYFLSVLGIQVAQEDN